MTDDAPQVQSMPLRLAAEQQREGGPPGLRDTLIQQALDEGHSVGDVAEALGLTVQAVYRVREKQGVGSRHLAQPADMRATADALERLSDSAGFERGVCALIGDIDPAAIPLGGPGDRGRDAAVPDGLTIFTVSLARQWQRKVRSDLARIEAEGFRPERIFAVTNRRTARRSVEKLSEEAETSGIELHVLDQSWLVAKLSEPRHLHLRRDLLGLPSPRARTFLSASEYRQLLDGRPHLAGMSAKFSGRERELERAAELLASEGVAMLRGGGGMGKTRLALQLAIADGGDGNDWWFIDADMPFTPESIAELPVSPRLVVVIDNAHRRERLGELVTALDQLRRKPRVVLISRPGYEGQIESELARTWLGPIGALRTVDVGPLRWETMAAILRAPPLEIESGAQRGELVRLAEGNPQVAVIAARVAKERRSVVGLSGDDLLQRYIAYLISSAIPAGPDMSRQRQLLALLAALDGIEADDEELVAEVGSALRIAARSVGEGLEQLAECGLAVSERRRYRIKPDLLAEHVLFALTLSGNWETALDYRDVFERFGPTRLARLVKAVGALPAGLIDDAAAGRLAGLQAGVEQAVRSRPPVEAAALVRALCRPLPRFARGLAIELLNRVRRPGEPPPAQVVEALRDGAMQIADFPQSWRLLLRLGAECAGSIDLSEAIAEAMGETYERLPEGDASSGAALAWVQDSLASETKRFWASRPVGAASAVALALRPMLTLSFETRRISPDNPMALEIGGRILPGSEYTERVIAAGGRLAAEVFGELSPAEQLKLLETAGWATHAAAGFPASMGKHVPLAARAMLDRALTDLDRVLAERLEALEMPVRARAYGHLLKRERYRRKLRGEVGEEGADSGIEVEKRPIFVPAPSKELDEYIFLINNGELGPPDLDRGTVREEHARRKARAGELAAALAGDPAWRRRLDRWSAWWESRQSLEKEPLLGPSPAMVFDALARGDAERGAEAISHLIETGSGLRGETAVGMGWVIRAGLERCWKPWLGRDPETRATLAAALANCEEALAAEPLRRLAFDEEAAVRRATQSALAFSIALEPWRLDLALEAAAADPEIEAIGRLLHLADHRAEEDGQGEHRLDEKGKRLVRQAILGTAASPRLEGYRLADSLGRAGRDIPGLAMEWTWARLEQLDLMREGRDELRRWELDFLPDELEPLVSAAADEEDLTRAIRLFAELEDRSPAIPDAAKLIGWLGAGAEAVSELICSLLAGERAGRARSYLLDFPLSSTELDRRAETLAGSLEEPTRTLIELIEGTQPTSWSGSYVPHLEAALAHAERWIDSPSAALREAGREARDRYRRQIESEKVSEEIEDREFEYR